MKRLLSLLLVAMLIVTSLSVVAFATEGTTETEATEETTETVTASVSGNTQQSVAGGEATLTFTVSGKFANYELYVASGSDKLTITGISGMAANLSSGWVGYAVMENVSSHSFTVTVKVAEDAAPGKYYVNISQVNFISDENLVDQPYTVSSGVVVIPCPGHQYGDWETVKDATCTEDGSKKQVCSLCGDEKFETISKLGHDLKWFYNDDVHWQECQREGCDHKTTEAAHQHDGNGYCVCGHYKEVPPSIGPDDDDELPMGDITPVLVSYGAVILLAIVAAAYLLKRKFAK